MYKTDRLRQIYLRDPRIAFNIFSTPLGKLILKQKNGGEVKNSFYHLGSLLSKAGPIQLNRFQADLIWCDGTFNLMRMNGDGKYIGLGKTCI
jgi:hypothetical protein